MVILIALIGVFLIFVGMAVLIVPQSMRRTLEIFLDRRWMPAASLIRIVLGLVCILVAGETRLPTFVLGFGVLVLIAGIAIPFLGFERIERLGRRGFVGAGLVPAREGARPSPTAFAQETVRGLPVTIWSRSERKLKRREHFEYTRFSPA